MTQARRSSGGAAALEALVATLADQLGAVRQWLETAPIDRFEASSVLIGADVGSVVAHLVLMQRRLLTGLAEPSRAAPLPLGQYLRAAGGGRFGCGFAEESGDNAGVSSWSEVTRSAAIAEFERVPVALAAAVTGRAPTVGVLAGGPDEGVVVRLDDWLTLGLIDVVLHVDDLNRSLDPDGANAPIGLIRAALAAAVRGLAEVLATQAPGRSVEVRVPPFVAVQAIAGPRHTRGTPPNVIELSAMDWLRLATGRTSWELLIGMKKISASGLRASLVEYVPLLG